MNDVERCRQVMRAAQKAYMYSGKPDEALNNVRYDLVGIEAVMRETRLIDAEFANKEAGARKDRHQWQIAANWRDRADWLQARAGGDND